MANFFILSLSIVFNQVGWIDKREKSCWIGVYVPRLSLPGARSFQHELAFECPLENKKKKEIPLELQLPSLSLHLLPIRHYYYYLLNVNPWWWSMVLNYSRTRNWNFCNVRRRKLLMYKVVIFLLHLNNNKLIFWDAKKSDGIRIWKQYEGAKEKQHFRLLT